MRLLKCNNNGEFSLAKDFGNDTPQYAILSHTWGADTEEVTFKDLIADTGKSKAGYNKIRFCGEQARRDGLQYFWVDTCCIDKSSNVELSEAINSMFRWYSKATRCYAYLTDVSTDEENPINQSFGPWGEAFKKSRWFTRGWTLQELIAPSSVEFFSLEWKPLGDKKSLLYELREITGIATQALEGVALSTFSIAERMSWAETRETKREEDKAYSLLGIFDVYMPLIYGEGVNNAFRRLRKEISEHSDDLLNRLPYAAEAPFNSYHRQHETNCFENTRVDLLNEIEVWAYKEDQQSIFWLNGLAGTGKSTIARTIARKFHTERRLGASFFFSRGGGDVGHAGKFVTSVARQLTSNIPNLYQHVCDAITEYSDITKQSLIDQWHHLVISPLAKLNGSGCHFSYFLVVDALDECSDDNSIQSILHFLAGSKLWNEVRLRVFLTSRPEIPVRYGFTQIAEADRHDFVLHNISPSIVDHDISIFLEYSLRLIGRERSLGSSWPGEEAIESLVQSASGLFIWAATACQFISDGKRFAVQRLHMIINSSRSTVITPERHLNEIYLTVLKNSIYPSYTDEEKDYQYNMLRSVLGSTVTLFSPLSASSLGALLQVEKQDIDQTVEDLHSILNVPQNQTKPIRLLHPSFRDFLLDSNRCTDTDFQVNEKQAHQTLASGCIQLLSRSLQKDICKLDDPGILAKSIVRSRVERCLPSEVQYACLYWIQHLQKSEITLHDDNQVHQFLQKHLLHWIEALGWMQKISEAIHAIISLESITAAQECYCLNQFVHDAKRFVLHSQGAIEQAPFQVYCSALVFSPTNTIVRKRFEGDAPQWMEKSPKVEKDWSALIQTLEGHSHSVHLISFAPNGKLVASRSYGGTIKIWDAISGIALHTLKDLENFVFSIAFSHDGTLFALAQSRLDGIKLLNATTGATLKTLARQTDYINCVTFSPQGKLLAVAISDKTITLWDTSSGAVIRTLGGYRDTLYDLAFSSDGKLLASGSDDGAVYLWNIALGVTERTLHGHSRMITAVAFSPDSKLITSASRDRTVKIWDVETGTILWTWKEDDYTSGEALSLAFSPNGTLLASGWARGTMKLWDTASGVLLHTFRGHSDRVDVVAFSLDGTFLASGSADLTIKLWDTTSVMKLQKLENSFAPVESIAFSPDGTLMAAGLNDGTIKQWSTDLDAEIQTLGRHLYGVQSIAFSPDGKLLASASGNEVIIWDVLLGEILNSFKDSSHWPYTATIGLSFNGKLLARVNGRLEVALWDIASGTTLAVIRHIGLQFPVSVSPDGRLLASGSREGIELWDVASGMHVRTLEADGSLERLAFSDDGNLLLTDRGPLQIDPQSPSPSISSSYITFPLSVKGQWVVRGTTNMLWLPAEYRPDHYAVCGGLVALAQRSGRITILKFAPQRASFMHTSI